MVKEKQSDRIFLEHETTKSIFFLFVFVRSSKINKMEELIIIICERLKNYKNKRKKKDYYYYLDQLMVVSLRGLTEQESFLLL